MQQGADGMSDDLTSPVHELEVKAVVLQGGDKEVEEEASVVKWSVISGHTSLPWQSPAMRPARGKALYALLCEGH